VIRHAPTLAVGLLAVAVLLVGAGAFVWQDTSPQFVPSPSCQSVMTGFVVQGCGVLYVNPPAPRRLHPLRAEVLWGAGALILVAAVGIRLLPARGTDEPLATGG
jgi:hypothetical protein